jgi:hypothetical protein
VFFGHVATAAGGVPLLELRAYRRRRLQKLPGDELMRRARGREAWIEIEDLNGQLESPGPKLAGLGAPDIEIAQTAPPPFFLPTFPFPTYFPLPT